MVLVVVDICRVTGNVIIYIVCVPQERHLVPRLEVRIDCRERSTQVEEGDTEKKEETRDFSCQFPEVRRLRARGNGLFCAHGVYVVYVMYGREQRESLSGFFFIAAPASSSAGFVVVVAPSLGQGGESSTCFARAYSGRGKDVGDDPGRATAPGDGTGGS